ncbi:hypothetical protein ALI144C_03385 [Actinosynnema sp. ALI-1.44]|uniref:non-homologous end-joining DNA ligase LigD n=1 Tax=Actinosynnema sp. ALI-1.44 TaxID=1933779 RepID=UPI00097C89CA|nr:hypothetical protein [Actinosynnema sp. ALI-1.44]ONI90082.1 hypothetical protein ALI144C_03385 [Actinosynnema sp. ALI-1.44]
MCAARPVGWWSISIPVQATISPYSLRGRAEPTAAAPLTRDEVDGSEGENDLVFTAGDVVERAGRFGDILAGRSETRARPP